MTQVTTPPVHLSATLSSIANEGFQGQKLLFWGYAIIELFPPPLDDLRCVPSILRISQPESEEMAPARSQHGLSPCVRLVSTQRVYIPLLLSINKSISGMEYGQVVHVLNVALLEMSVDTELFSQEVKCIKCFGLRFSDRWYFGVPRKLTEANEITPPVLQRNPLRCVLSGRMVKQQRSFCVLLLGVLLKSG